MPNRIETSAALSDDRVLQSKSKVDKLEKEMQDGAGHNIIDNPGFSTINENILFWSGAQSARSIGPHATRPTAQHSTAG